MEPMQLSPEKPMVFEELPLLIRNRIGELISIYDHRKMRTATKCWHDVNKGIVHLVDKRAAEYVNNVRKCKPLFNFRCVTILFFGFKFGRDVLAAIGTNIIYIYARGPPLGLRWDELLAFTPQLRCLEITELLIEHAHYLGFPRVTRGGGLTDIDLKAIIGRKSITFKHFDITDNSNGENILLLLAQNERYLESLTISGMKLFEQRSKTHWIDVLSKLTQLKTLSISTNEWLDTSLAQLFIDHLPGSMKLIDLKLSGNTIPSAALETAFSKWGSTLENISLESRRIINLEHLSKCVQPTALYINGAIFMPRSLMNNLLAVAREKLRELDISIYYRFDNAELEELLASLPNLTLLHIRAVKINVHIISTIIQHHAKMRQLKLFARLPIKTADCFRNIDRLRKLEILNIKRSTFESKIAKTVLKDIFKLPVLRLIWLPRHLWRMAKQMASVHRSAELRYSLQRMRETYKSDREYYRDDDL